MQGLNLILKAKLPLKIKIQITRDNLREMPNIKKFIEGIGLKFRPSYVLYARLNHDSTPCNLRISPYEVLSLDGKSKVTYRDEFDCSQKLEVLTCPADRRSQKSEGENLFRCAIGGGDGIHIDPYGNTFVCNLIRKPAINLLKVDISYAISKLLPLVRNRKFVTDSRCNGCNLRELCLWCPGRALVETGNEEMPLEYYCKLAHLIERENSGQRNG
jgi:radical SAM protein with 4Fe4S-binding SPASM domain